MKTTAVTKQDLATKIVNFITNANPRTLTIQLWRLPENGIYNEIEINEPIANVDNETLIINDVDDVTLALSIDLSNIASITYGSTECIIMLNNGEAFKLASGMC